VIDRLRRRWARRGGMPDSVREELEREGLELLEERLEGTVTYRGYEILGQRPTSGVQKTIASLALTPRRLAIRGTGAVLLDAPPGPVTASVPERGVLMLAYQAEDVYASRSGSVELRLRIPRAEDIRATLEAWNETPSS
jgi:hypothetical protein